MRSVEAHGSSIREATAVALTALDVEEDRVDIEVLRRPRLGLFGRGGKVTIRATLKEGWAAENTGEDLRREAIDHTLPPTRTTGAAVNEHDTSAPRERSDLEATAMTTDLDTTDRAEGAQDDTSSATEPTGAEESAPVDIDELTPEERIELLDEECDIAADFVEGLLDLLDLPGDIVIEATEESAVVNITDVGSGLLIGRRGATLDALQELVRSTTQRQTERRSHVRVDVEGYRARHLDKLRTKCRDAIAEVRETGEPSKLEPMDAYERKMMHDLVARTGGVTSSSEGSEPRRRVVIQPD